MHTRQTDVNKRANDGNIVQLTVLIYLHAKLTSYILNFYVFVHVNVLAAKAAKAVEEMKKPLCLPWILYMFVFRVDFIAVAKQFAYSNASRAHVC